MLNEKNALAILFTLILVGCGGNRVLLKSISDNTPQEKNNVFATIDLNVDKPNKIMVFIWQKHNLFGIYRLGKQEEEIGEITPNSAHNASNVLAEFWDQNSSANDRYKVCIDKDKEKCIPINYYSSDSTVVSRYK